MKNEKWGKGDDGQNIYQCSQQFNWFEIRLCLDFSYMREHNFKHNFQDTLNPLWGCSLEIESTEYFFLCCQNYNHERQKQISKLDSSFSLLCSTNHITFLLYGNPHLKPEIGRYVYFAE